MANQSINSDVIHSKDSGSAWPGVKANAIISMILSYLSVIIGGLGLYALFTAWQSFPLILIAWILWGISCVGLRRLSTPKKDIPKRDAN
jgi:hypothetical protein